MSEMIDLMSEAFGFAPQSVLRPPAFIQHGGDGPAIHGAVFEKNFQRAEQVDFQPSADYAWLSICLDTTYDMAGEVAGHDVSLKDIAPGTSTLLAPRNGAVAKYEGTFAALHIYIPAGLFNGTLPHWLVDEPVAVAHYRRHKAVSDIVAWHREAFRSDRNDLTAYGALLQLTGELTKALAPADTGERLAPHMARKAEAMMQGNLAEPVRVADLSNALNMSEAHFARAFRNTTGSTPGEALRKLRMDRARGLLENDTLGILDIAAEVGYADPSSFAKAFRDTYGMTPARWRREKRH